ncbi:uroporphyrinogen-III C-methyltransferase [Thalassotalea ganghwensis]
MTDNKKDKSLSTPQQAPEQSTDFEDKTLNEEDTANDKQTTASSTIEKHQAQKGKPVSSNKHQPSSTTATHQTPKAKVSKVGVLALLIALSSIGGVAGLYWYQNQQIQQRFAQLTQAEQASERKLEQLVEQLNDAQEVSLRNTINDALVEQTQQWVTRDEKIALLEQQIARLQQNQPSDWLIYEAEYLLRIASRTLWLEKDSAKAIELLLAADKQIKKLNDPKFLTLRLNIKQDIDSLKVLPQLEIEEIILSLQALSAQVYQLPLVYIQKEQASEQPKQVSNDIADWRENLKITWDNFVEQYFTLRPVNVNVKPLLSPEYQQNLRENLLLKLSLAQGAAARHQTGLYQQTLAEISQWIDEYFDTSQQNTTYFIEQINALSQLAVDIDLPTQLSSLQEIRVLMSHQTQLNELNELEQQSNNGSSSPMVDSASESEAL